MTAAPPAGPAKGANDLGRDDKRRLGMLMFDLDGTLIESLAAKDAAFAAGYAGADRVDQIMAYHRAHNHVVRFEKFRHISERILETPLTEEEDRRLRDAFAGQVVGNLIACPEVPGARALLDRYRGMVPMVLISHSPDAELRHVLDARGLTAYFADIYSADWSKRDAIRDALEKYGVAAAQAVYIGDSPEDAASAADTGVAFIGRRSDRDLGARILPVFDDMTGVQTYLEETHDHP